MSEIFQTYPGILWAICGVIGVVVGVLVVLVLSKKSKKEVSSEEKEQQKLIDDYIKEEKKSQKSDVVVAKTLPLQVETVKEEVETKQSKTTTKKVEQKPAEVKTTTKKVEQKPAEVKTTTKKVEQKSTEVKTTTKKVEQKPTEVKTTTKKVEQKSVAKGGDDMASKTVVKKAPQGKYEIFEVEDFDSFKYILKASNGEKLVESELYASKDNVKNAIEVLKRNLETGSYNIQKDKNDMYQFKLTAGNNRQIATSANYSSKQNAEKALESFKRFAADSVVVEIDAPKGSLVEEIKIEKVELQVNGKIVIANGENGWTFKLVANNGEVLCTSKPYSSKANCEDGIVTFKTSINEGKFLVSRDKNKLYQFKLQTQSKRLIAVGQTYEDKQRAISSANSAASFSETAKVVIE